MSRPPCVSEALIDTARLRVFALQAQPAGGSRAKVLLLGGSNSDLRLKRAFLTTELAQQCEIATYEPRGIGRTAQPEGVWTLQDYAQDAVAVLDALGWQRAAVVGESFGGMTALHLALAAPDRVSTLVVASATAGGQYASVDISRFLDLPLEEAAASALCLQDARFQALQRADPACFQQRLSERCCFERAFANPSVTSGGYRRLLEARRTHDCTTRLHEIAQHVLVIAGRHDQQAPVDHQKHLATTLPDATYREFEAGHGVLFGMPEAVGATVDTVLAALDS